MQILFASCPKDKTPCNPSEKREDEVGEMVLRLSTTPVQPRNGVGDFVGHGPTKNVDERRGEEEWQHRQAGPLELPSLRQQRERGNLQGGLGVDDHDAVGEDSPYDGGKQGGPQGVEHRLAGASELEPVLEEAYVGPEGPGHVSDVVKVWAVLSGPKRPCFLAICEELGHYRHGIATKHTQLFLRPRPPGLGQERDEQSPRYDTQAGREVVSPSPRVVGREPWCRDAESNDDDTLARNHRRHSLVPLVDEDQVLDNQRNQSLDGASTEAHQDPCREMLVQALAESGEQPASPGASRGEEEDGPAADPDGRGYEEVARDAVRQQRHRSEEGDLVERGGFDPGGHNGHGVDVDAASAALGLEVDIVEDVRVDAGVLEEEDGEESTDDHLCREGNGAN